MQMEALECGAASLAMVLAYYQKWIPLERVRFDCAVSRDGSNGKNIMKAARNYGMEVKSFRLEPEILRERACFSCIVHWNFNHFVIVCGFSRKYAYINDPARGSLRVSLAEFDKAFTGACILLAPADDFIPEGRRKSTLAFARWADVYSRSAELTYAPPVFLQINSAVMTAVSLLGTILLYYTAVKIGVTLSEYIAFNVAYHRIPAGDPRRVRRCRDRSGASL